MIYKITVNGTAYYGVNSLRSLAKDVPATLRYYVDVSGIPVHWFSGSRNRPAMFVDKTGALMFAEYLITHNWKDFGEAIKQYFNNDSVETTDNTVNEPCKQEIESTNEQVTDVVVLPAETNVCQQDAMQSVETNNNEAQTFVSEKFGSVRVMSINGEPWFVAADVCKALEINNPTMALSRLDEDEKMTLSLTEGHSGIRGGAQMANIINEPGLYTLVLGSRKPEAKEFKRWVTHEVIPTIRKTGGYIADPNQMVMSYFEDVSPEQRTLISAAFTRIKDLQDKNIKLSMENSALTKDVMTWDNRAITVALIRSLAVSRFDSNYSLAFNHFYKQLRYRKNISLSNRKHGRSMLDGVQDSEWGDIVQVAVAVCSEAGIDVAVVINQVNADKVLMTE